MKQFILLVSCAISTLVNSQSYMKQNIDLIGHIAPNNDTIEDPNAHRYSGCWGWFQASKNKEYAISGTSNGTYFIDVTSPASPSVCAFVPGKRKSTWREMKTYQNYCYIVTDDEQPNKFTIVDMQYLPDSVHIVHYGNKYFERGHTIWIDKDKMYIGATTYSTGSSCMTVWSLATPTNPVLLRRAEQDIPPPVFSYVHDMYVKNDTIYASTGWQGLHILKLESNNTLSYLGSYAGYPNAGYNHSSSLTQNSKYLVFCDEVPGGIPIQFVDVQNPGNVQPLNAFKPNFSTTPHNPYLVGNKWAVVSCYKDGLYIYDISNPPQVSQAGFFDTYPQGGANALNYGDSPYNGNWGAYPYLPSGRIIANDMQNGVFILDAAAAFSTTALNPVGVQAQSAESTALIAFPSPADKIISVHFASAGENYLSLYDLQGKLVVEKHISGKVAENIDVTSFPEGTYTLFLKNGDVSRQKKITVRH
jgi:choice-of-anchor B domain-containing protein